MDQLSVVPFEPQVPTESDAMVAGPLDPHVLQCIEEAVAKWSRTSMPKIVGQHRQVVSAGAQVINRYEIRFGQKLGEAMGKGSGERQVTSKQQLVDHAQQDVAAMTDALVATVEKTTGANSSELFPMFTSDAVARTGVSAVYPCLCGACAGCAQVTCPGCFGRLQITCTNCQSGQARCTACAGSGQISTSCYSCGGSGGSYSAAATWDHQYQQNTWDYQNRQTASGGQWQPCSACAGQRIKQTTCSSCQYGRVTCPNCSGRGHNDCTGCQRTGMVTCTNCFAGYRHFNYVQQVEVKHTHEIKSEHQPDTIQRRVLLLAKARLAEMAAPLRHANFVLAGTTVVRSHDWVIPATVHSLACGNNDHKVLEVGLPREIVDYDGMGDALLDADLSALEKAKNRQSVVEAIRVLHASPIHAETAITLAPQIGLKSLLPFYSPSSATVDARLLVKTCYFNSRKHVGRYVDVVALLLRKEIVKTHGVGIVIGSVGLIALASVARFAWAEKLTVLASPKWVAIALLVILLGAEVSLWLRSPFKGVASGQGVSKHSVVVALLGTNALHWFALLTYVALFLVFKMWISPALAST